MKLLFNLTSLFYLLLLQSLLFVASAKLFYYLFQILRIYLKGTLNLLLLLLRNFLSLKNLIFVRLFF